MSQASFKSDLILVYGSRVNFVLMVSTVSSSAWTLELHFRETRNLVGSFHMRSSYLPFVSQ
jgi:hypothetical protein